MDYVPPAFFRSILGIFEKVLTAGKKWCTIQTNKVQRTKVLKGLGGNRMTNTYTLQMNMMSLMCGMPCAA